tara:strand:- start:4519 stop:4767 length:249 start_codon:yes stop_codon:yes gene_type:complete
MVTKDGQKTGGRQIGKLNTKPKFTLEKIVDGEVVRENHPSYYSISKALNISYHRVRYYHLNCKKSYYNTRECNFKISKYEAV